MAPHLHLVFGRNSPKATTSFSTHVANVISVGKNAFPIAAYLSSPSVAMTIRIAPKVPNASAPPYAAQSLAVPRAAAS
jgi:hypothetical protein